MVIWLGANLYQRTHVGFLLVQNKLSLAGDLEPIERAVVLDPDLVVPLEERLARHHTDGRLACRRMLADGIPALLTVVQMERIMAVHRLALSCAGLAYAG